jgi:hypothetical protein
MSSLKYYPFTKNWSREIEPHLDDPFLNHLLVEDFHKFTFGQWRKPFGPGMHPRDFESCDWDIGHRGREPRYWRYVKHSACHWVVNFCLRLATLAEPKHSWRIVTSQEHSTVWDGDQTLFDINFLALSVEAPEAFRLASKHQLPCGLYLPTFYPDHFSNREPDDAIDPSRACLSGQHDQLRCSYCRKAQPVSPRVHAGDACRDCSEKLRQAKRSGWYNLRLH